MNMSQPYQRIYYIISFLSLAGRAYFCGSLRPNSAPNSTLPSRVSAGQQRQYAATNITVRLVRSFTILYNMYWYGIYILRSRSECWISIHSALHVTTIWAPSTRKGGQSPQQFYYYYCSVGILVHKTSRLQTSVLLLYYHY